METDAPLSEAWNQEAEKWVLWARKPGHDSYWQFHRDQFFELVPPPGKLTIDVGCGEGRVSRDLKGLGHSVKSFDASPAMIKAARDADPSGSYEVARAETLPLPDSCADLVVLFMVLQDVDDLESSVKELSRILTDNGRACLAIVHPLNSAGNFSNKEENSEFIIKDAYLKEFRYTDVFERDGLSMTFHALHRTLAQFSRAFESAGLCIEAIREHAVPESACRSDEARRWRRIPLFMHFRLVKSAPGTKQRVHSEP
jgi:ubiquinone/menaquinone biosynthesis C-methylase UbiE